MSIIKISVIVPIYNMEQRLDRCLTSLREVTLTDIEFLLINDGSKDGSEAICEKFVKEDNRFSYRYKDNGGVSSARNVGFSLAKGKYITYVDSDDYIDPKTWSGLYELAEQKDVDILNFGYSYVRDEVLHKRSSVLPKNRVLEHEDVLELLSSETSTSSFLWFPWSNLFKKSFLNRNKISFREDILYGMEDTIFILDCYCNAKSIYAIDIPCYFYVYYAQSLTQINHKPDLLENINRQYQARLAIYEEHGLVQQSYFLSLARHYMEHTFFAGVRNIKNNGKDGYLNELKKMRSIPVYEELLLRYRPSEACTVKMKLLIYLFKFRLFRLLKNIY